MKQREHNLLLYTFESDFSLLESASIKCSNLISVHLQIPKNSFYSISFSVSHVQVLTALSTVYRMYVPTTAFIAPVVFLFLLNAFIHSFTFYTAICVYIQHQETKYIFVFIFDVHYKKCSIIKVILRALANIHTHSITESITQLF